MLNCHHLSPCRNPTHRHRSSRRCRYPHPMDRRFHRRRDPPERTPNLSSPCRNPTHRHRSSRHYRHQRQRCCPHRRRPCLSTQFHRIGTHHTRRQYHRCHRRNQVRRRWCRSRNQRARMNRPVDRCHTLLHSHLSNHHHHRPRQHCPPRRHRRCRWSRWDLTGSRH